MTRHLGDKLDLSELDGEDKRALLALRGEGTGGGVGDPQVNVVEMGPHKRCAATFLLSHVGHEETKEGVFHFLARRRGVETARPGAVVGHLRALPRRKLAVDAFHMGGKAGKQGLAVAKEHRSRASRRCTPCLDEGAVGIGAGAGRLFEQRVSLIHGPAVVVRHLGV